MTRDFAQWNREYGRHDCCPEGPLERRLLGARVARSLQLFFFFHVRAGSDFGQRDLVGVGVALDVQDKRVLVGVVLDDIVVHVHQDAGQPNTHPPEKKAGFSILAQ